jgi:hypothetical protein
MIKEFPKCRFTLNDTKTIIYWSYVSKINILVMLAKLQQEQGLIELANNLDYEKRYNQAMGCRLYSYHTGKRRIKYYGFTNQIEWGSKILRWYFEDFEYGNEIRLEDGNINNKSMRVWSQNAATYSLYMYCPSFGVVSNHPWTKGREFTGNSIFAKKFEDYKKMWIKHYGSF